MNGLLAIATEVTTHLPGYTVEPLMKDRPDEFVWLVPDTAGKPKFACCEMSHKRGYVLFAYYSKAESHSVFVRNNATPKRMACSLVGELYPKAYAQFQYDTEHNTVG